MAQIHICYNYKFTVCCSLGVN